MTDPVVATLAGTLLAALCGAVGWLVRRVVTSAERVDSLQRDLDDVRRTAERPEEDRAAQLLISELELRCERRYMARDAAIPQMSLMAAKIDSLAQGVARVEERLDAGRSA